jgi:hypothetical protein
MVDLSLILLAGSTIGGVTLAIAEGLRYYYSTKFEVTFENRKEHRREDYRDGEFQITLEIRNRSHKKVRVDGMRLWFSDSLHPLATIDERGNREPITDVIEHGEGLLRHYAELTYSGPRVVPSGIERLTFVFRDAAPGPASIIGFVDTFPPLSHPFGLSLDIVGIWGRVPPDKIRWARFGRSRYLNRPKTIAWDLTFPDEGDDVVLPIGMLLDSFDPKGKYAANPGWDPEFPPRKPSGIRGAALPLAQTDGDGFLTLHNEP